MTGATRATEDTRTLTRSDAEEFLYHEAELLDGFQLDRWLELFTDDAVYWVPARHDEADPQRHVSLIYDDRGRIEERIWRLTVGPAHAQIPPSVTRRLITNVRVSDAEHGPVVRSNFAIFEVRKGTQRSFAGEYEHRLVPHGAGWRIRRRTARLVNCEAPIFNLTFLV
ncbi:aromatic-ring-hydroxylating dioxygenase subunit beta [Pseudonocardia alaniniphila]|uniref:Aromatic-ring-hydroxylating dioxygenase subunit beta n=1 Tax=Pseudonocardia alaniniphila TaxID=75291 RepID=A0ABS9TAM5_9PSEU|nr:aromatic-ring-hydroxylating dioxygenase subunit beta [Pseudonocardia alaniniphila]MCH6165478.1 aromatic-ring-hydroxylating dioxygenase subunit beta [Pseudonocardia alaniniphila]